MKKVDFCKRILYFVSQLPLSDSLFLEGGMALSEIYKIDRKFSGDMDFTVSNFEAIYLFGDEINNMLKKISGIKTYCVKFIPNKKRYLVTNSSGEDINIHFDLSVVDQTLFEWQKASLFYRGKPFTIRVHSLRDIMAEKICCLLSFDRVEERDLFDVKKIRTRLGAAGLSGVPGLVKKKSRVKFPGATKSSLLKRLSGKQGEYWGCAEAAGCCGKEFELLWRKVYGIVEALISENNE